eukprot:TRINITY_DN2610_c0_g1_i1.p1 TRINITY_DN2610_c0_g1~~TRINITY_DN2610_c0_g1_i1.p1  ORF type:complete len:502 (-),score=102.63 TRINITY_DN2610_c0_g1_i1:165-1553(-)
MAEEPITERFLPTAVAEPGRSPNHQWWKDNLRFNNIWREISGSLGDLGTFVPIVIALTLVNGLDLGTTLIFTGLYNAVTGLLFGVPMPVQPMKSIAAVAISEGDHLRIPEIMAAGICTAGTLFVLGITGLMGLFYHIIPLPVVRGIQLSQGLSFAFTAVKYIRQKQDFASAESVGPRSWTGWDGILLALFCLLFLVIFTADEGEDDGSEENSCRRRRRRTVRALGSVPSALIVVFVGILIAILRNPSVLSELKFGPSRISLIRFSWEDFKVGFLRAAIPQIPLSILNSVIAVCKLSADLFPEKNVSATRVSASVGAMNLVGCWFGAMPVCHGAGGLAGQYRFGARGGSSVVFLGAMKLGLGLALGSSLLKILTNFPIGLLGVLLLFSGVELAMASRDMNSKRDSFVMLVCTAVSLTGSSAALGFVCGLLLYLVLMIRDLEYSDCSSFFRLRTVKSSEHAPVD